MNQHIYGQAWSFCYCSSDERTSLLPLLILRIDIYLSIATFSGRLSIDVDLSMAIYLSIAMYIYLPVSIRPACGSMYGSYVSPGRLSPPACSGRERTEKTHNFFVCRRVSARLLLSLAGGYHPFVFLFF